MSDSVRYFPTIITGGELSTQQKIEFLEEATIMMDFDHQNVLSLTAICIKEDLPYVILPLMENGDLKSFTSNSKNVSFILASCLYLLLLTHDITMCMYVCHANRHLIK